MPDIKLKYYQDPGHGWVACKRKLLEDLGMVDFSGIDWAIVGGES